MTTDQLINLLVTITLIEMMVAVGLGVTFTDLVGVARDWRLVTRAGLANYVCVPAATVGLLLLFDARPMVAAGFLILAVCPGAPFGPPCTAIARGNVTVSVGLMVVLAASSALAAPLLLHFLLPLLVGAEGLTVDPAKLVGTLLLTQLAPLSVGIAVRQWRPALAERMRKPANVLSLILILLAMVLILVTQFDSLLQIQLRGLIGMLALLIASLAAGWLLSDSGKGNREATALTTSLRNVGVALVIASGSFADKPGGSATLTAVVAYGLFEIFGSLLLALAWARRAAAASRNTGQPKAQPVQGEPTAKEATP
ncbi:MAG: bile acid:sodium symporter [Gemmataceae bacterium]|nr:bile acid:sodium symporter [Gemmataceae bacterium]